MKNPCCNRLLGVLSLRSAAPTKNWKHGFCIHDTILNIVRLMYYMIRETRYHSHPEQKVITKRCCKQHVSSVMTSSSSLSSLLTACMKDPTEFLCLQTSQCFQFLLYFFNI